MTNNSSSLPRISKLPNETNCECVTWVGRLFKQDVSQCWVLEWCRISTTNKNTHTHRSSSVIRAALVSQRKLWPTTSHSLTALCRPSDVSVNCYASIFPLSQTHSSAPFLPTYPVDVKPPGWECSSPPWCFSQTVTFAGCNGPPHTCRSEIQ